MSEKKKIIITIARQYGSGGADTGKKLAEDLGISFYDKNILRMNSDESGIKESYFHLADEKAGNRLLYKIINTLTPEKGAPSFGSDLISADNLFRFQSEVIRKLAAEESCVIIGSVNQYLVPQDPTLCRSEYLRHCRSAAPEVFWYSRIAPPVDCSHLSQNR